MRRNRNNIFSFCCTNKQEHSLFHFHQCLRKYSSIRMVHCVFLMRQNKMAAPCGHMTCHVNCKKVDTKWTRFPMGLDGLAIALRLLSPFATFRHISCLVYILTHRWGSVLFNQFQMIPIFDCKFVFDFFCYVWL